MLALLSLVVRLPAKAEQQFYFKHLTIEQGLPQNTVFCIMQDVQGFMWFGTKDGLCRYDGNRCKVFRKEPSKKHSLGNNFVRSLYQDSRETIWVGTDRGVYLYDPQKESFTRFDQQTGDGLSIVNEVNDIRQDKEGNIWFAVDWQGIFMYDTKAGQLSFFELSTVVNAWSIHVDDGGNVWIGTHEGGIKRFDKERNRLETIDLNNGKEIHTDNIYKIAGSNFNKLLVGTANNGVKKFDPLKNRITDLIPGRDSEISVVRSILHRTEDEIWLGGETGLYLYDQRKETLTHLKHDSYDKYSLSDNSIYAMYKDREGGIWIGTYFGGVNYLAPEFVSFEKYYPTQSGTKLQGERIREMAEDKYRNIWIGTEDNGLSIYNTYTKTFDNVPLGGRGNDIRYSNVHGLMIDRDKAWVGVLGHGIDVVDIDTRKVVRRYEKGDQDNTLCNNSVFSLYKDNSDVVWVGTLYGLCTYNQERDDFTKIDYLGDAFISNIIQTNDGNVWFATMGKGLYRYSPMSRQWRRYEKNGDRADALPHNKIITLFKDSRGRLWIGTEGGGAAIYDAASDSFATYTTENGLPNNVVYKIVEDDGGNFWITTNNGLTRISADRQETTSYTQEDGLLSNQFNYNSGLKASDGKIYLGSPNGLIAFRPGSLNKNQYVPPVYISGFALSDRYIDPQSNPAIVDRTVNCGGEVNLTHKQSTFHIDFAALSYVAPTNNKYQYMLKGYDHEWNESSNNRRAYYSNVKPGRYLFLVKGSNNDDVWNKEGAALRIDIHPPFYLTTVAKLLYGLTIGVLIYIAVLWYKTRNRRKIRQKLELFDNNKTKELYKSKIAFFTNIAHEIRTPLSLIKAPMEYLMHNDLSEDEKRDNLKVIDNNTNRLLDLVNQLLDFRKTETEDFQLYMVKTDVVQLTKNIFERFVPTAKRKNISFTLTPMQESIFADIDMEGYRKIISNMLSNAIKYADSSISMVIEERPNAGYFEVRVSNDGYIIPKEYSEKIFEPLYQMDYGDPEVIQKGTGLGLPLSRSLATLHNGSLFLDCSDSAINVFVLNIPTQNSKAIRFDDTLPPAAHEHNDIPEEEPLQSDDGKKSILIVEDNKEMQRFLYKIFRKEYNVVVANNGKEALDKLGANNVDLIISDIMMPVMDGLELLRKVKSLLNYSHIPLIMLTAKTGVTSNIEGLEAGADAYIEKPFSTSMLKAQVENLFENRRKMQVAFTNFPLSGTASIASSQADERFLDEVTKVVYEHMTDEEFNVDALAEKLNMSRSSLHRKIKNISELTPNDFILLVRLKKAAELLKAGEYRINEIGYVVGFSSSSYFSKSFKKHFGLSPSEFIRKI